MESETIGLVAIGGMITAIVVAGLCSGIDGTLTLTGIGSLATIFGVFIEKLRKRTVK